VKRQLSTELAMIGLSPTDGIRLCAGGSRPVLLTRSYSPIDQNFNILIDVHAFIDYET